jgi:hypothetical protein
MALIAGVDVSPRDRDELQRWVRSPSMPAGMVMRARIVLAAADGWTKTADEILLHATGVEQKLVGGRST